MRFRALMGVALCIVLGVMVVSIGCSQYEECKGSHSESTVNPNGIPCNQTCHCSNRAFEGVCVEGRCKSRARTSCAITGDIRGCSLIVPKEGTKCLSGKQVCNPKAFQDRGWPQLWSDCTPLDSVAKEENTRALCLDRINNDCDDKVDLEEPSCKEYCFRNSSRSCYTGPKGTLNVGACAAGTQYCDADSNKWVKACSNQVIPSTEVCNGVDDDCDGDIDEDLPNCQCSEQDKGKTEPCYTGPTGTSSNGICRMGTRTCEKTASGAYRWSSCTAQQLPKKKEDCNKLDDNCNGLIDEGCPCPDGSQRACGNSIGDCQQGTQLCLSSKWADSCVAYFPPRKELCDGRDNDCNGLVDDKLVKTCPGECGFRTCTDGEWSVCKTVSGKPKIETCNNKDDDCNGLIDENLSDVCPPHQACLDACKPFGKEALCKGGIKFCAKGNWLCTASAVIPSECKKTTTNPNTPDVCTLDPYRTLYCVRTIAGKPGSAGSKDGAPLGGALLTSPEHIHFWNDFNTDKKYILFSDTANHKLRYIQLPSTFGFSGPFKALHVGSTGTGVKGYKEGTHKTAQFNAPGSLFVSGHFVYLADSGNFRIRELDLSGSTGPFQFKTTTLAGSGQSGNSDGSLSQAKFSKLNVITGGDSGSKPSKFMAIDPATKVRIIDVQKGETRTPTFTKTSEDPWISSAIWVDSRYLLFTNAKTHKVHLAYYTKPEPPEELVIHTLAGSKQGFKDGDGSTALFNAPKGISCADPSCSFSVPFTFLVADSGNNRIRAVTLSSLGLKKPKTVTVRTLVGEGTAGFKDGSLFRAQFNHPTGIVVRNAEDGAGLILYVADTGNHIIRRIGIPTL